MKVFRGLSENMQPLPTQKSGSVLEEMMVCFFHIKFQQKNVERGHFPLTKHNGNSERLHVSRKLPDLGWFVK